LRNEFRVLHRIHWVLRCELRGEQLHEIVRAQSFLARLGIDC